MSSSMPNNSMSSPSWNPDALVAQEPERQSGLVHWWYQHTAPPRPPANATLVRREADRKARLLSIVAFFFMLTLLLFLPASFFMPFFTPLAVIFAMAATLISLVLNRAGKTTAGGVVITMGAEIALTSVILMFRPMGAADIQLYDLYVLIILLAVSLLPPRYIFLFAVAHCAFITGDMLVQPHTQALADSLRTQLIPAIARPVGLQLLSASVTYIWVRSATRAIERANRAELVAKLEHTISEERAIVEREKQEMDESIQQLIRAHVDAANGQLTGRIPYPPAKALWPLVGAINSLWVRSQRAQQLEQEHQQLQQAIAYYVDLMRKNASAPGQATLPLVRTGTSLDQLLLAIKAHYSSSRPLDTPYPGSPMGNMQ